MVSPLHGRLRRHARDLCRRARPVLVVKTAGPQIRLPGRDLYSAPGVLVGGSTAAARVAPSELPSAGGSLSQSSEWRFRRWPLEFQVGIRSFELGEAVEEPDPAAKELAPATRSPVGTNPSFIEAIRSIAGALRQNPHSHTHLNRAASEIDQLGRRLHGYGLVHEGVIAGCLTEAVRELGASNALPERERAEAVLRAVGQLEAAAAHAEGDPPQGAW